MRQLSDLGEPDAEFSGRRPLRIWIVEASELPEKGVFIPTKLRSWMREPIWIVVAPVENAEVNDEHEDNGRPHKHAAEVVAAWA